MEVEVMVVVVTWTRGGRVRRQRWRRGRGRRRRPKDTGGQGFSPQLGDLLGREEEDMRVSTAH